MTAAAITPALGRLGLGAADRAAARAGALRRPAPLKPSVRVHALVSAHAARTPDVTAVRANGEIVSYAQLDARIARLAARLHEYGVGPGQVVAVSAERGPQLPVAFLALEAVGAVYVPIETTWPAQRRATVLAESGARAVLVDTAGREALGDAALPLWPVDDAGPPTAAPVRPGCTGPADEARYVIFTSGTTGTPKGAVVEHRGMVNHLAAKVDDLGLTPEDRVAFIAPIGFDISIWQMLAPLVAGACLVVVDEQTVHFARRMVRTLADERVTVAEVVPTIAAALAREYGRGRASGSALRWLLTTGEALRPALAGELLAALPDVGLMNAYGPTECSDDVTHHRVTVADIGSMRIPIGAPVANCDLYLLVRDADGWRAARADEPAELFVGGVSVGRGYLGRPDLTAAAFYVDELDPHSPTGRLYRTGDLVVRESDVLVYLGRTDRQVKVGGVRMELDEIEAVLARHDAVAECAVVLSERSARIDAYVVSADAEPTVASLLAHARAWLPAAAVPSGWRIVDRLPTTGNGKVDHRALTRQSDEQI